MTKTVFLLVKVPGKKKGEEKTYWNRAGVAFDANKDGSVNFKLDLFPDLTFQIRDRDEEGRE